MADIETMKTMTKLKKLYDKAPEIREKLREALHGDGKKFSQGEGIALSEIIPEGYETYNPAGSGLVKTANSAYENIIQQGIQEASDEYGVPLDEILSAEMIVNDEEIFNQLWVIPTKIKNTLKEMAKKRNRSTIGVIAKGITSAWKTWATVGNPLRMPRFFIRNFTGDLDAMLAGNPGAVKFIPRAVKELSSKEQTQDLKDFLERRNTSTAIGDVVVDARKIFDFVGKDDMKALEEAAQNAKDGKGISSKILSLLKKIYSWEVGANEWRENILRYTAYLSYLDDMKKNKGMPSTWGASNKDEVLAIGNIKDRAAKMSNELLGAYDQVSEFGKGVSDMLIPFWRFQEVNLRRYYRLLRNGFKGDNAGTFTKWLFISQTAKVPFWAVNVVSTLAKLSLLHLIVQAFNRFVFPDDDDELPNDIKYRAHLTLGKWRGRVYYFDRIGSMSDAADWLNLDSIFLDIPQIANGQLSAGEYLKKMIQAPVSKFIGQLNPFLKMPMELAVGRSLYPDAFNSRTIRDNWEHAASSLGINWPYKAITGKPRSDAEQLTSIILYSLDPDEAAYYQTLDKVRQYQERVLDRHFDGMATTKRGNILRDLKTAMRYNDKAAIRRYLQEYAKLDGTTQGLKNSIKAMQPLHGLSASEKRDFLKWLSDDDKKYLHKAEKYYRELLKVLR